MRQAAVSVSRARRSWAVVTCLVSMVWMSLACIGAGDEFDEEGSSGPAHACFVHCQSSFGVSSACFSSGSDYRTESSCSSKASDYCGDSGVSRSEMTTECNCSASCEPEWYNE